MRDLRGVIVLVGLILGPLVPGDWYWQYPIIAAEAVCLLWLGSRRTDGEGI